MLTFRGTIKFLIFSGIFLMALFPFLWTDSITFAKSFFGNIITKSSVETQGIRTEGIFGTEDQSGRLRYGGKVGENLTYCIYGKYFNKDSSFMGNDAWYLAREGFQNQVRSVQV